MIIKKCYLFLKSNKKVLPAPITLSIAVLILVVAPLLDSPFKRIVSIATFLTWHNLFELISIVACLAIFLVAYYTYNQTNRLRTILLGNMLLAAGIIDVFHMLSYKGMPEFFVENTTANRATTFWIAARLITGTGFLIASLLADDIKCNIKKHYFAMAAFLTAFAVFIAATYFPLYLPAMYIEGSGLTTIKKLLEYFVMLMLIVAAAAYLYSFVKKRSIMSFTMFCALLLSVLSEFAFTIYIDVYGIYNYEGHILEFVSLFMIFRVIFVKNVQALYIEMIAAQKELKDYADNLDGIVEQRTRQLKIINGRLMEDLEYARDIQNSMLPVFLPDTPEIEFSAVYLSAERLSGDFYDVFKLDENNIGFYVCDVSGHGVPAAMLTVFLKQCVDSIVEADRHKGTISSPSSILQQVYDAFNNSNFKDDVYIVLVYAVYNTVEKKLVCCSAGLNEAPLLLNNNGEVKEIDISGFPICKLKEVYTVAYSDFDLPVKSGDRLYIYTDGLVEARNSEQQQYSKDRLKKLLEEQCNSALAEQCAMITDAIIDFSEGKKLMDDATMLAVEIR